MLSHSKLNRALAFTILAAIALSAAAFPAASAAPITTLTVSDPKFGSTTVYVNQFTEFTLTVDPQGGPTPTVWYHWDGYDFTLYTMPFGPVALLGSTGGAPQLPVDLEDGAHSLYYNASGETTKVAEFTVDNTVPETEVLFIGEYYSGDYLYLESDTAVSMAADDDGSGVASIIYSLDGGADMAYSSPFKVTGSGIRNLTFHSLDSLGNTEPERQMMLFIDNEAPEVIISASNPNYERAGTLYVATGTAIRLEIHDMSGISSANYSIDGGVWKPYDGGFYLGSEGTHTVNAKATDNLGHESAVASFSMTLDSTPPTVYAPDAVDGAINLDYGGTVALLASDAASGDPTISYSLDGGSTWTIYMAPIIGLNDMNLTITAVDALGNSASWTTIKVYVSEPAEPFPWKTYLGAGLIVGGCILAVAAFLLLRRKGGDESPKERKPRKRKEPEEGEPDRKRNRRKR